MGWYRQGTVSIANGATAVTGSLTAWTSQAKAEDRITFDGGGKWYEIASVASNTSLTLATAFAETTVSGGAYAIDRSGRGWSIVADLAARVAAVLGLFPPLAGATDAFKRFRANAAGTAFELTTTVDNVFWTGAWLTATGYDHQDAVEHNGSSYICTDDHTSGASTEPGVGASWATVWDLMAEKGADGAGNVSASAPFGVGDRVLTSDGTGTDVKASTVSIGEIGGYRNRLLNGCMRINQRAPATNADDTYAYDRWNILTQTGTVAVSAQNLIADGWSHAMRVTQSQASAQRFGVSQIVESRTGVDLRGRAVTLSARVRMSASTTLRYAILEWTGTADAVTSDVVNSWTNGTFTAGQFFNSTTLTVTATGSTALTANTPAVVSLSATIGSSMTNVIVLFWTDSAQAQNVTLDIGQVQLEPGLSRSQFEPRDYAMELAACQRFYQRLTLALQSPAGGALLMSYNFPVPMRATPTTSTITAGTITSATVTTNFGGGSPTGGYFQINAGAPSGFVIDRVVDYTAEL